MLKTRRDIEETTTYSPWMFLSLMSARTIMEGVLEPTLRKLDPWTQTGLLASLIRFHRDGCS